MLDQPRIEFSLSAIPGKRCVQIEEPQDSTWKNPYICVPNNSWYQFTWEHQGVHGKKKSSCMKFKLPKGKDGNWCDNSLCTQEKSDGEGMLMLSLNPPAGKERCIIMEHCDVLLKGKGVVKT